MTCVYNCLPVAVKNVLQLLKGDWLDPRVGLDVLENRKSLSFPRNLTQAFPARRRGTVLQYFGHCSTYIRTEPLLIQFDRPDTLPYKLMVHVPW